MNTVVVIFRIIVVEEQHCSTELQIADNLKAKALHDSCVERCAGFYSCWKTLGPGDDTQIKLNFQYSPGFCINR